MISTAKRPVPLEHYLYAGRELWKIVDASRAFQNQGYDHLSFASDLVWVLNPLCGFQLQGCWGGAAAQAR